MRLPFVSIKQGFADCALRFAKIELLFKPFRLRCRVWMVCIIFIADNGYEWSTLGLKLREQFDQVTTDLPI